MDKLIEKISSYNLLNNILPGAVIYYFLQLIIGDYDITLSIVGELLLYYFIGLLCSRLGSLILELICKKTRFIEYANYSDYLEAEKNNSKISVLLETNNMYRTFSSGFIILVFIIVIKIILNKSYFITNIFINIFVIFCFILFLFSYKKQTKYIKDRVNNYINKK